MTPVIFHRTRRKNQRPEADFKKAVRQFLELRFGRHAWRLAIAGGPYQRNGSPDEIWSIRGLFVAMEFKAPGKQPSPAQADIIAEILASGGRAAKINNWQELEELISGIEPVQPGMWERNNAL
jgi:hypothetical protein